MTEINPHPDAPNAFQSFEEYMSNTIADVKRNGRQLALSTGEFLKEAMVRDAIATKYDPMIRQITNDEFYRTLMKSIIYEEQVHEYPPFLESMLEQLGLGDSVGLSQIRVSIWGERYNVTREDLLDAKTHLTVMMKHLRYLEGSLKQQGRPVTYGTMGSAWNSEKASHVTDYGRRVEIAAQGFDPQSRGASNFIAPSGQRTDTFTQSLTNSVLQVPREVSIQNRDVHRELSDQKRAEDRELKHHIPDVAPPPPPPPPKDEKPVGTGQRGYYPNPQPEEKRSDRPTIHPRH